MLPLPSALILVFRATISVPRAVVKAALAVTFRTNGADAGSESVTVATDEVQPTHASTSTTNDTAFMLLLPCGDGGTNLSGTAASCRARSNCDPTDVSTTFSTATSSMQLCVSTILTRYILCHSMLAVRVGSPLKGKGKGKGKGKAVLPNLPGLQTRASVCVLPVSALFLGRQAMQNHRWQRCR